MFDVRPSPIAGTGTFADRDLAAGAVLVRLPDAPSGANDLGALNHSCDPNLGWADDRTLVALRDITSGTELVLDYATAIADDDFVLYCHCETYRCRQVIEGGDWRIPQLQQRYATRWHPTVQALIDDAAR